MNSPHDRDPFQSRLRQRLQATPIELPEAAGPIAAADRAAQRSRRRRGAAVSVAAVAVLGALSPLVLGDDGDDGVNTEYAASIDADGVELDWQVHDDGLAMVRSSDQGDDGFYALSTAPGTRYEDFPDGNAPRALYRWDGSAWQPVDSGDDSPHVAEVSERNGSLYSLSTSPETGAPLGAVSTDGGESWTSVPLGSVTPPSDSIDWQLAVSFDLASTADTTVAVVNTRFLVPGVDLFADDIADLDNYHWETSDAGVELYELTEPPQHEANAAGTPDPGGPSTTGADEGETLVRTIPWEELGVDDPSSLEPRVATFRADGETWTPVADAPAATAGTESLVATDTGVLLRAWATDGHEARPVLFHTVDGTAWTPVATPTGSAGLGQSALAPNGAVLHVEDSGSGGVDVSVSSDFGATWSSLDMTSLVPELDGFDGHTGFTVSTGPLGVAMVMHLSDQAGEPAHSSLLYSPDLRSWTVSDLTDLLSDRTPFPTQVLVGTDRIIVQAANSSDPDDSEPAPTATLVGTPVR